MGGNNSGNFGEILRAGGGAARRRRRQGSARLPPEGALLLGPRAARLRGLLTLRRLDRLHLRRHDVVLRMAPGKPILDEVAALLLEAHGDAGEPRRRQHGLHAVVGRGARDSAGQGLLRAEVVGDLRGGHHVVHRHPPPGPQHPHHLPVHLLLVGREVDDAVGDDHIHRAVLHRQILNHSLAELHVGMATGLRVVARLGHHLGRHVHTDDAAGGPHGAAGEEGVEAGAAAEVQHRLPRLQRREAEGVAAAQPQVRHPAPRHRELALLLAVPEAVRGDEGGDAARLALGSVGVAGLHGAVHAVGVVQAAALLEQGGHEGVHRGGGDGLALHDLRLAPEQVDQHARGLVHLQLIRQLLPVVVAHVDLK
mmetsp:Transcript_11410/g.23858  ORF Transcript_11410/g.23858 Transcript_11410/m.23858 type:complete len:366 (+) Transcript_11410:611-1708(+)